MLVKLFAFLWDQILLFWKSSVMSLRCVQVAQDLLESYLITLVAIKAEPNTPMINYFKINFSTCRVSSKIKPVWKWKCGTVVIQGSDLLCYLLHGTDHSRNICYRFGKCISSFLLDCYLPQHYLPYSVSFLLAKLPLNPLVQIC